MNIFKEIYNLYLTNKGTFDTLFGIILGSFLTHVITTNQVKKNNKFILIKDIKLDLQYQFEKLFKLINELNIDFNEYYKIISKEDYKKAGQLIDEVMFKHNEIIQIMNVIQTNQELLVFIFNRNEWTLELNQFTSSMKNYLSYFIYNIHKRMTNYAFYGGDYTDRNEYSDLVDDYYKCINNDEIEGLKDEILNFNINIVTSYLNVELSKLVRW